MTTFLVIAVALLCALFKRRKTSKQARKVLETRLSHLREGQRLLLESVQRKDQEAASGPPSASKDFEDGLPESSRIVSYLWDSVYEQPTTQLGLKPDEDHFALKRLFNRSLRAELVKAKVFTLKARDLEQQGVIGIGSGLQNSRYQGENPISCHRIESNEEWLRSHDTNLEEVADYLCGEKLQQVIEIAIDAVSNLGKQIIEADTQGVLLQCKTLCKDIQLPRHFALKIIVGIAIRVAPLWILSNVFFIIHILGWTEFDRVLFSGEIGLKPLRSDGTYDSAMGFQLACNCLVTCAVWWVAHAINEALIHKTTSLATLLLRSRLVECLLFQDYSYFETHNAGKLQALINEDAQEVSENFFCLPKEMVGALVMILIKLYVCFQIAPAPLVLRCLAPIPIVAFMNKKMMDHGHKEDKKSNKIRDQVSANINDVLSNLRTVRTFANEAQEVARFQGCVEQQTIYSEFANLMQNASISAFIFCITASVAWSTYLAGESVAAGEIQVADLTVFTINMLHQVHLWQNFFNVMPRVKKMMRPLSRVINLLKSESKIEPNPNNLTKGADAVQVAIGDQADLDALLKSLQTVESNKDSTERFNTAILAKADFKAQGHTVKAGSRLISMSFSCTLEPEPVPSVEHLNGNRRFPMTLFFSQRHMPARLLGQIKFDNVKFHYPTDLRKQVLTGMTFEIQPGQKIGICGSAGCGKTTTLDLLQRLYDVDCGGGAVYIDGVDIRHYNVHFLRQRIGVVAQRTVLFKSTVRENVWYGMQSFPGDEAVEEALKQAQAWDFIQEKPDKLLTVLTETGGGFSGGQMQRLAIARCLIRNPDVILLDEATAALDPVNERLVQDTLDVVTCGRYTTLAIAHRLTTIKDADKILVVDHGKVVEEGSHAELMTKTILHDEDDQGKKVVKSGFYRNQWQTQFNERVKEFKERPTDSNDDLAEPLPRLHLHKLNKLTQSKCKGLPPPPPLLLQRAATVS